MYQTVWRVVVGTALLVAAMGIDQESFAEEGDQEVEALTAELEASLSEYEYFGGGGESPLEPTILQRWNNQVRGGGSLVGLTVVWSNDVRPQIIASVYPWDDTLTHMYDVLSRNPDVTIQQGSTILWRPQSTGLEFQRFPDASPPSGSESRRRIQMKELARAFRVTMTGWAADDTDREELRLLPQSLCRYGADESPVFDGALFAFTLGTDPEAALMIEAVRTGDDDAEWQFAFVRQTSGGLEATLDEQVVWTAAKRPYEDDPKRPHFRLLRPLAPGPGAAR